MKITLEECKRRMDENNGDLDLSYTQITSLPEGLTVGGGLDLEGTPITALPGGLIVGGHLDLSDTKITSLPEGLTVGDWLDLRYTKITALPEGLTVGGRLYCDFPYNKERLTHLKDGDETSEYIFADGILSHITSKRRVGEYTLYVGKIKGKNVVTDGKNYAHCDSLRDGISDLLFKSAKDRGADVYKSLKLTDTMTIDEAKTMYRIITGACKAGTQSFVDSLGEKKKDVYTIKEMIDLTRGAYGSNAFQKFFVG